LAEDGVWVNGMVQTTQPVLEMESLLTVISSLTSGVQGRVLGKQLFGIKTLI
jgi:hypothetical protein